MTGVLVAPDKLEGTRTAAEAAVSIARGRRSGGSDGVELLPFADGGDGTAEVVVHAGGSARFSPVSGPFGSAITARWSAIGDTAVLEGAGAAGLRELRPTADAALHDGVGGSRRPLTGETEPAKAIETEDRA